MSLFSGFVDTLKGIVSPFLGSVGQAGASIGAQQIAGTAAPATAQGLQQTATEALQKEGASKPGQASTDVLMRASKPVAEAFSYGVNRPVATIGLLTDPNSPLYQAGMGEGFQPSDVVKAWNRTQVVTPMQAATKSILFQDTPIGSLSDAVLKEGNVNLKKVNLWDDKDIEKNFVQNTVGKWFTGTGDFVLSNAAAGGALKIVGGIAKGVKNLTNLTTSVRNAEDLAARDAEAVSHINGTANTTFGSDVVQLAETTNPDIVIKKVRDYSNNPDLARLITKTTNPIIVKDLILADNGYQPAFARLQETEPAMLWELGDTTNFIKGNAIASGKLPRYSGENLKRVNAAYDKSIQDVPAHKEIYDAFKDETGSFKYLGTGDFPTNPKLIGGLIGSARARLAEITSAATVRDFTGVGGIAETLLGGGAKSPGTILLHFFGTKLPRGYISFSGMRPWDHVDEMNAVFDDIPLFKSGNNDIVIGYKQVGEESTPVIVKASQYRRDIMARLADAKTPSDKAAIIEEIDSRLGEDIARSRGITNMDDVRGFVSKARSELNSSHNDLIHQGYSFDAQGNRLVVNASTQRQIADTIPMIPWGDIDRSLIRHMGGPKGAFTATHDAAHSAFDAVNKVFSISVLGRPAYVPKNSVIEPLVSASLAMGHMYWEDTFGTAMSNAVKNNKNRILSVVKKVTGAKELKAVNKRISDQFDKLQEAYHIRDNAYAEWESAFNNDGYSPATKLEHGSAIKADLKAAQDLVNRIEVELSASVKNYGNVENIPTIYGIRRRIDFLKSQDSAKYASEIRSAEILLQKAVGDINTMNPALNILNKNVEDAWKLLDSVVEYNKLAKAEQGALLAEREQYKMRYYGKQGPVFHKIGNNVIEDSALYDPEKFGDAVRSEFSNADTAELTVTNELRAGSKYNILARKSPTGITDVTSPLYFEELTYVINRALRGDKLIDQILADATPQSIMEWANSEDGLTYFRQFGKNSGVYTKADIPAFVNTQINMVRRYIPDPVVRAEVLKAPATPGRLQELLANKMDILSPIHPTDFPYGEMATLNKWNVVGQAFDRTMSGFWKKLASVENPFRWLYGEKRFYQIQENKLNVLHQQGVPITAEQINATRQASQREALQDAEKTFYTIRRNNRAVYATRTIASFPAASINALYRLGRLAVKNPARTALFLKNYNSMYESFGIDANGNKVDDPSKAVYIVVPGTKELGIGGDKGIRLSARTVGFLANTPGPSWLATYVLGRFMQYKPTNEEYVKHIIDSTIGHIPGMNYNSLFPQGAGTDISKVFIPSWAQDALRYITSPQSDKDFMTTYMAIHKYNSTMAEMGYMKPASQKEELQQTRDWYLQRALWKFASPFGMTPKMDRPGQMFQDLVSTFQTKNNGDFDKTTQDVLKVLGASYNSFPVDRYLYKGQSRETYVTPTFEGYKRVWEKYSGLAVKLADIDPSLVGLLTADVAGDPDAQVQKFLSDPNVKLPGGKKLNIDKMTPEQWERKLEVNRTWNLYRSTKQDLMDALNKAGYKTISENPDAQAQWTAWLDKLAQSNKDWGVEYKQNISQDKSYSYAQAFKTMIDDAKFKNDNRTSDFFKNVKLFMEYRESAVAAYKAAPKGSKTAVQSAWNTYLQETTAGKWNPELQQIIDRYFINDKLTETL